VITTVFAGVPVAEYVTAYDWYALLIGREADMFPHQTEAVWRVTPSAAIYVVQDPTRAGNGLLTVALDDLDEHEERLRSAGITYRTLDAGDAPRRLAVEDADGNTLTFFQDPGKTSA
jgi:catechol 2,3-dioxygenase-like lactoylglutathione lyase family enzyme